ncbi:MAG: aldo/keto reductase [Alphaproteobacteria bacterium]|nr:aldo/keto reductase [Alphaproteobacteria bacterium]
MQRRKLGASDLEVSIQGYGCMGLAGWYGPRDDREAEATLLRALDLGINFLDTADVYGGGENETFIGGVLKHRRRDYVLATKFGSLWKDAFTPIGVDCSRAHCLEACDASLKRLGVETIDLYYAHRVDPNVPIEETVGAMAELVKAGKVRYLGLSEAGPNTLKRAHQVHPITALQTEYSLLSREPEAAIIPACRELGIAFVAYSPVGRGMLSGHAMRGEALPGTDFRSKFPRFTGANFEHNLGVAQRLGPLAKKRGCTPAQLALAWLHAKGPDIFPLPGPKRRAYLEENAAAAAIELAPAEVAAIEAAVAWTELKGTRYPESSMSRLGI